MKNIILSTVLGVTSLVAMAAHAGGSDSKQFQVKLTVAESCQITTANDVDFGSIDRSQNPDLTSKGNLGVNCTLGTPYKIALAGNGKMSNTNNSGEAVPYQLFQDSNYETIWNTNSLAGGVGSGSVQNLPVYAQLDGMTNVSAGQYIDTVVATVTY